MSNHPKERFYPLCDLHHSSMRRVMLEQEEPDEPQSFHQCDRRDCDRIFRDGYGYSDYLNGHFDQSRTSSRICPACGATLYLAEVDHTKKIETWDCAEIGCDYSEEASSPSSR